MGCSVKIASEIKTILDGVGFKPGDGRRVFIVVEPTRLSYPVTSDTPDGRKVTKVDITDIVSGECGGGCV